MISLAAAVSVVIYLIIGGLVFGLLWWAVNFCETQFPSPFWRFGRVILILLAVFVLISVLLSMAGIPLFRP